MKIVKTSDPHLGEFYAIQSDTASKAFRNPMTACRKVRLFKFDVVVDVGGFIGEYAMLAALTARKVTSYEASPHTYKVIKRNSIGRNFEVRNMAVVGDDSPSVELFLSKGIGATNSVVKRKGKGSSVIVPAIRYENAVKEATVVKIDVEGAEYDYNIIQPNLRAIILEFHPLVGVDWEGKSERIMTELEQAGFKCLLRPKFQNGWDTNSAWVRN